MYKVLEHFIDLQDNRREYNPGDHFPGEGSTVSEERIAELASDKNKRRRPVIEEVKADIKEEPMPEPKEPEIKEEAEDVKVYEKPKRTRKRTKKSAD